MKDLPGCEPVSFNGLVGLPRGASTPRGCGSVFRTRLTLSAPPAAPDAATAPPREAATTNVRHASGRRSAERHPARGRPRPSNIPLSAIFDARRGRRQLALPRTLMSRDALPLGRHDGFQHHDHRYDRLPPAKITGDECPPQSSTWESPGYHTNPPSSRNDALQQHDPEAHALHRPLSSRHSLSQPARRHRLAPDTFPHAATRRHCPAVRPTATASRCRQASRSLAPRTPTTRCTSKPSTGSPGNDADPLFRPNRRAFTRIPSSRNDAFQQHDPKAAAR
jgi:hypothetical protein